MTDPVTTAAPELIGIGAQSIVDRAQALGLTWDLRPATVVAATGTSLTAPVSATYDGDISILPFVNITGMSLFSGQRVMAMTVPPAGNFIVGFLGPAVELWHPFNFANGWHNAGGASVTCQYRLLATPPRSMQLIGEMQAGTLTGGVTVATFPAGYQPVHNVTTPIAVNSSPASGGVGPLLQLTTAGNLTMFGATPGCSVYFSMIFPLDA